MQPTGPRQLHTIPFWNRVLMGGDLEKTDFDFVHPIKNAEGKKYGNFRHRIWLTVNEILWPKWKSLFQIWISVHFHIRKMKSILEKCMTVCEKVTFAKVICTFVNMISIFRKWLSLLMQSDYTHLTNMIVMFGKIVFIL